MATAVTLAPCVAVGAPPSFPTALDREPLLSWLTRETDILPGRVVAVTPQALTAVVSAFPPLGDQPPRVVLRAEALSGETHARTGALSWHVSMSADCRNHRVRLGETTGYVDRNLLGERRVLRPPETEWRTPEPGTALDNAWRVACDASFVGPLEDPSVRIARADSPPPAAATPVSATAPEPPAAKPLPPAPMKPPRAAPADPPAQAMAAARPARGVSVQVGSYPDRASASAALAAIAGTRDQTVETAVVAGRTWYRAVLSGFASADEAAAFCAQRKAQGGGCLLRGAPRV